MTSSSRCRAVRWVTSTPRRSSTPTRSAPTAVELTRSVAGLVLAAGAGRRFGGPKALALTDGVPWVVRAVDVLRDAGVGPVVVVVGAAAAEVAPLVSAETVVRHPDWASGMGGSLRVGLDAVSGLDAVDAVVVMLVDLPGVTGAMIRRLMDHGGDLLQASFGGVPGHPVLLGRAHWAGVAAVAHGDIGARDYLREHGAVRVPLGSAADGADVDTPAARDGRPRSGPGRAASGHGGDPAGADQVSWSWRA